MIFTCEILVFGAASCAGFKIIAVSESCSLGCIAASAGSRRKAGGRGKYVSQSFALGAAAKGAGGGGDAGSGRIDMLKMLALVEIAGGAVLCLVAACIYPRVGDRIAVCFSAAHTGGGSFAGSLMPKMAEGLSFFLSAGAELGRLAGRPLKIVEMNDLVYLLSRND